MGKRPDMGAALASSVSLARAARDEAKAVESEKAKEKMVGGLPNQSVAESQGVNDRTTPKPDRSGIRKRPRVPKPPASLPTPLWSKPKERYFNFRLPPEAAELLDDLVYVRKKAGRPFKTQDLGMEALESLFRKDGLIQ